MEGENNKKLVETFLEITSSSNEEALFFLESHNWDLDSAVSTFLEDNSFNTDATTNNHPPSPSPSPLISSDFRSTEAMDSSDKKPSKPSGSRTGRIRTFSDLNRQSDSESDNDSDELKEYFTGGEKSGMPVQDPSRLNDVDAIFNQARQLGAVERPTDHLGPSSISRSFTGTGRLLSGETVPSAPQPSEPMIHNITFWANGFTVNDGPLRRLDNPENEPFLESIMKSECPKELEPVDRSKPVPVHVNIIRRDVDCPEPEKRQVPFQGVGMTLGSGTTTTPTTTTVVPEPSVTVGPLNTTSSPSMGLIVDETLPSTLIQLRLSDGTRMVARFNYHHSISDIRAFIDASRPGGVRTYRLQTVGFPPKQLTDVNQTIEQAGLANSVVIQNL